MASYMWVSLDSHLTWGGGQSGQVSDDQTYEVTPPWSLQRAILDIAGWSQDYMRSQIERTLWSGAEGNVELLLLGVSTTVNPVFDIDVDYSYSQAELYLPGTGPQSGYFSSITGSLASQRHADANVRQSSSGLGPSGFTVDLRSFLQGMGSGTDPNSAPNRFAYTTLHARCKLLLSQPS